MSFSRRKFLKSLVIFFIFPSRFLFSSTKNLLTPKIYLNEKTSIATSLRYSDQSTKEGKNCLNCLYYASKDKKEGPCNFPVLKQRLGSHPYVAAGGYCSMWKAKANS